MTNDLTQADRDELKRLYHEELAKMPQFLIPGGPQWTTAQRTSAKHRAHIRFRRKHRQQLGGPPADGIWKISDGEWVRVERVTCSSAPFGNLIHAAFVGRERALCGRRVDFRYGPSHDHPAMIQCATCRAAL